MKPYDHNTDTFHWVSPSGQVFLNLPVDDLDPEVITARYLRRLGYTPTEYGLPRDTDWRDVYEPVEYNTAQQMVSRLLDEIEALEWKLARYEIAEYAERLHQDDEVTDDVP